MNFCQIKPKWGLSFLLFWVTYKELDGSFTRQRSQPSFRFEGYLVYVWCLLVWVQFKATMVLALEGEGNSSRFIVPTMSMSLLLERFLSPTFRLDSLLIGSFYYYSLVLHETVKSIKLYLDILFYFLFSLLG